MRHVFADLKGWVSPLISFFPGLFLNYTLLINQGYGTVGARCKEGLTTTYPRSVFVISCAIGSIRTTKTCFDYFVATRITYTTVSTIPFKWLLHVSFLKSHIFRRFSETLLPNTTTELWHLFRRVKPSSWLAMVPCYGHALMTKWSSR